MLRAPLPAARVARSETYRVRVLEAPPRSRCQDMINGLRARGDLPANAKPVGIAQFEVTAMTYAAATRSVREGVATRGHQVQSLNRSTGNDILVYVVNTHDREADARKLRG